MCDCEKYSSKVVEELPFKAKIEVLLTDEDGRGKLEVSLKGTKIDIATAIIALLKEINEDEPEIMIAMTILSRIIEKEKKDD